MDDGGGFPTINYVPIDHSGGNILEGLMQLYGAYKQMKSQKQSDAYLSSNSPAPGVTNSGALDAWKSILGGQDVQSQIGERGAEGAAATSNAASRATEVGNEQTYQTGELADRAAQLAQTGKYQQGMLDNDTAKLGVERQTAANTGAYQQGELADSQAKTAAMDKDRSAATADKAQTASDAQLMALHEKYLALKTTGLPLSPQDQADSDAVTEEAFKRAGIKRPTQATPQPGQTTSAGIAIPGRSDAGTSMSAVPKRNWLGQPESDPLENATPGAYSVPATPASERKGGSDERDAATHLQQLAEHAYKLYAAHEDYANVHGDLPAALEKKYLSQQFTPEQIAQFKQRYTKEQTSAEEAAKIRNKMMMAPGMGL